MPYCQRCGKEVSKEISICPQCGGALSFAAQPDTSRKRVTVRRSPDLLGLVSVGVVLILVGVTYYQYTISPSVISDYIQSMVDEKVFIKPPLSLLDPMIFFFNAVGVWGIVLSGLRIALEKNIGKAIGDFARCLFAFFCAFLIANYAANRFTEQAMGGYFFIAVGLLIVANAIISLILPEKK